MSNIYEGKYLENLSEHTRDGFLVKMLRNITKDDFGGKAYEELTKDEKSEINRRALGLILGFADKSKFEQLFKDADDNFHEQVLKDAIYADIRARRLAGKVGEDTKGFTVEDGARNIGEVIQYLRPAKYNLTTIASVTTTLYPVEKEGKIEWLTIREELEAKDIDPRPVWSRTVIQGDLMYNISKLNLIPKSITVEPMEPIVWNSVKVPKGVPEDDWSIPDDKDLTMGADKKNLGGEKIETAYGPLEKLTGTKIYYKSSTSLSGNYIRQFRDQSNGDAVLLTYDNDRLYKYNLTELRAGVQLKKATQTIDDKLLRDFLRDGISMLVPELQEFKKLNKGKMERFIAYLEPQLLDKTHPPEVLQSMIVQSMKKRDDAILEFIPHGKLLHCFLKLEIPSLIRSNTLECSGQNFRGVGRLHVGYIEPDKSHYRVSNIQELTSRFKDKETPIDAYTFLTSGDLSTGESVNFKVGLAKGRDESRAIVDIGYFEHTKKGDARLIGLVSEVNSHIINGYDYGQQYKIRKLEVGEDIKERICEGNTREQVNGTLVTSRTGSNRVSLWDQKAWVVCDQDKNETWIHGRGKGDFNKKVIVPSKPKANRCGIDFDLDLGSFASSDITYHETTDGDVVMLAPFDTTLSTKTQEIGKDKTDAVTFLLQDNATRATSTQRVGMGYVVYSTKNKRFEVCELELQRPLITLDNVEKEIEAKGMVEDVLGIAGAFAFVEMQQHYKKALRHTERGLEINTIAGNKPLPINHAVRKKEVFTLDTRTKGKTKEIELF